MKDTVATLYTSRAFETTCEEYAHAVFMIDVEPHLHAMTYVASECGQDTTSGECHTTGLSKAIATKM